MTTLPSVGPVSAVSARDLTVQFVRHGAIVNAVNGVSFDLAKGEVLTVIGESGSGKSVMLRAILGLMPSYARVGGSIRVNGRDLAAMSDSERSDMRGGAVSLVFQEPMTALDPVFTIGEQIAETIIRHESVSHATAWKRAEQLLDMVAVPSPARRLKNYPHEMSGGMRQRAMIALALSCRPSVLLADEPTTALDATVQIQLLLLLRQLQRDLGMAVIFVTHDMAVAAEISDRVAVMYAGRFVETGSVDDMLLDPKHPYAGGLLRSTVHAGMRGIALETIPGSPPDMRTLLDGCAFAPRCRFAEEPCGRAYPDRVEITPGHNVFCRRAGEIEVLRDAAR